MRGRFLKDESGFTLVEVLVTMMLMLVVMFALYSIFDMSLRVFGFGNDKTEATENARLGLEKMEREIRAAYPYDKATNREHLFFDPANPATGAVPSSSEITFGNDLNGNRVVDSNEIISYSRGPDPPTLVRENNGTSQPVVEFVDGLTFEYLNEYGATATTEEDIFVVRISLTTKVDRSLADGTTQTLSTDVALRNRTN